MCTRQRAGEASDLTLPSWVIDFSRPAITNSFTQTVRTNRKNPFNAALSMSIKYPKYHTNGQNLVCYGAHFDTITAIQQGDLSEAILPLFQPLIQFFEFYLSFPQQILGLTHFKVLWRTVMTDMLIDQSVPCDPSRKEFTFVIKYMLPVMAVLDMDESNGRVDTQNSISAKLRARLLFDGSFEVKTAVLDISAFINRLATEGYSPKIEEMPCSYQSHTRDVGLQMGRVVSGRRLFLTRRGLLGLAPENVREGDGIFFVTDAHTPVILRGTPEAGLQLLGDRYLYGFMHGETLDVEFGLNERIGPLNIG